MSTSPRVPREGRDIAPAKASVKAAVSEKRKQQNRAAQRTYREKRKRKLQELEALTSRDGPPNANMYAGTTTDLADMGPLIARNSSGHTAQPGVDNTRDNPDWLFEFIAPEAVGFSPCAPSAPQTTSIGYKMPFPSQPTAEQCTQLARIVFAAYTRNRNPWSTFDPYRNNLNVSTLSFAAGFFANALHLGLVESEYCTQTAQSNFFRPRIAESPYAETMMLAVQRGFDGLKPDLRPTPTQIVQSHHPAIDILPFPSLRRRLIEALSHAPPLINELEFWEDVRADGIVCWGNADSELGGGGVPWDARSWEAKTWFLDKYCGILGDEDDELWRGSQWWREIRGEYL
ncbi:hypothetical protein N0V90_011615 [Kalmusia sp. IMI 367209]|nr:hypothetical protein N0V90_011615 [Kalmusia sp. IMI 367209]